MTQPVDGVYDHTKPWRAPVQPDQVAKRWQYNGPWSTNAERLVSQALMVMNIPGKDIQAMVRPPLPQVQPFPPRFGDRTRELSIEDVMDVNEEFEPTRVDFTREPGGYQGTARNASESIW